MLSSGGLVSSRKAVFGRQPSTRRNDGYALAQGATWAKPGGGRFEMRLKIETGRGVFTASILGIGLFTLACSPRAIEERRAAGGLQKRLERTGLGQIEHIVFIVKENRSFDNYFGTFPGAEGATSGQTS